MPVLYFKPFSLVPLIHISLDVTSFIRIGQGQVNNCRVARWRVPVCDPDDSIFSLMGCMGNFQRNVWTNSQKKDQLRLSGIRLPELRFLLRERTLRAATSSALF